MLPLIIATLMTIAPGTAAPPIDATTIQGAHVTTQNLKGKVVMVDFWATWCGPCVKSLPLYQAMRERYAVAGLEVLAISIDDELRNLQRFVTANKLTLPIIHDRDKRLVKAFSPPKMPTAYLIDKRGALHYVHPGYNEGDERVIEEKVKALLGVQ